MTVRSAWHINNSQTREDTRLAPVGTWTPTGPLGTRSGVIPGGTGSSAPLAFTSTGAMTFQIGTGRAVVQGGAAQGAYPVVVSAPEPFTVGDGHATLPRVDSVILVVYDQLYDASGQTAVQLLLVQGTPASSPAPPNLPTTSSLRLYNIAVPAGASAGTGGITWGSAVTDVRPYTTAAGGIGLGAVDGAYAGQWRDVGGATGVLERYSGSAWESTLRLAAAGQLVIGGDVNLRRSAANVLRTDDTFDAPNFPSGAWPTWAITWTTSTGDHLPQFGNALVSASAVKVGRAVLGDFEIVFGSSTNFGVGATTGDNWQFSLPYPAARVSNCAGFVEINAGSVGGRAIGRIRMATTSLFYLETSSGRVDGDPLPTGAGTGLGVMDSLTPWIWASGYAIRGSIQYEAAA